MAPRLRFLEPDELESSDRQRLGRLEALADELEYEPLTDRGKRSLRNRRTLGHWLHAMNDGQTDLVVDYGNPGSRLSSALVQLQLNRLIPPLAWMEVLAQFHSEEGGGPDASNMLGITDPEQLRVAIYDLTSTAFAGLPDVTPDFDGVKTIHAHLFGEVYESAGQVRTDSVAEDVCPADEVEDRALELMADVKEAHRGADMHEVDWAISGPLLEVAKLRPFAHGVSITILMSEQAIRSHHGLDHWLDDELTQFLRRLPHARH